MRKPQWRTPVRLKNPLPSPWEEAVAGQQAGQQAACPVPAVTPVSVGPAKVVGSAGKEMVVPPAVAKAAQETAVRQTLALLGMPATTQFAILSTGLIVIWGQHCNCHKCCQARVMARGQQQ